MRSYNETEEILPIASKLGLLSRRASSKLIRPSKREHDGNVSACIRETVYAYLKSKGYKPTLEIAETVSA